MIPAIGFVGFSNSGKTTVIASLTGILSRRGYKVAAVKHASHGYDVDIPGKDSWQHFQAGAQKVIVVGPGSLTSHERFDREPELSEILKNINNVDVILIEGFKNEPGPKVEIIRDPESPRVHPEGNMVAVVSDHPIADDVPRFASHELDKLADFIIGEYLRYD